jgi:hypothetical protein
MDESDKLALLPNRFNAAIMLIASALILGLLNYQGISALLVGESGREEVKKEILPVVQHFIFDMLSFVTANAASFIFWIGVAYAGILAIDIMRWLYHLYRDEIPNKKLVHHELSEQAKKSVFFHLTVRSIALMGFLGWTVLFFIGVLPTSSAMYLEGLTLSPEIYKLPVACVLLSIYLYVGGILFKFITLRKHFLW